MSAIEIRTTDLAGLMSARPALLAAADLPGLEALRVPGLDLWLLARDGQMLMLRRDGAAPAGPGLPLNLPPSGMLAVVVADPAAFGPFLGWWQDASGQAPPLVRAASGSAALPALLAKLSAELGSAHGRAVQLERSLVATRQDYEETRIAMAAAARTLGHRPPGAMAQAVAMEPSMDRVAAPRAGARLFLRQPLGRKLEGLAAIAVHVGAISAATTGPLRLRVHAEESGRIAASWTVPMAQVTEGWLRLDLPTPLGLQPETAVLEITADVAGPHSLALSLEADWVPAEVACLVEGAAPRGRALALRIWTARIGDRFVVPAWWNWDEVGASLPLEGVPQAVAAEELEAGRVLSGAWEAAPGDLGEVPLQAMLEGAGTAALVLPRITLAGADVLRLTWNVAGPQPRKLRVGAWVLPPGQTVQSLEGLAGRAAFSGWRDAEPGRPDGLSLALPLSLGAQAQVVLAVASQDPAAQARLDFTGISLLPTRDPAMLRDEQAAMAQLVLPGAEATPELPPVAPEPLLPAARFGKVALQQHLVGGGGYQHLDLVVQELAGRGEGWSGIRFKLGIAGSGPVLEFRRGRGWPEAFTRWPGTESDKFGPVLRLRAPDMQGFAAALAHPRDQALVATLLEVLDEVAGDGARLAALEAEQGARWVEAARRLRGA
ncbi:DUF6212 domain-containing protein [Falsiroseomonas selenitidurans]|uniref:DUF4132 domain-containing protein n=1 Tax=Falsiroseomonas selenitidurans TaxID=2716335 RepID=A0ABX1EBC8_9PROT|nr:DUF6212 domain-containing protein [Falsiroseomonas selenitidurans]NKC34248.1 hypothetical protein [Falsiroseomonas selenitidurans]